MRRALAMMLAAAAGMTTVGCTINFVPRPAVVAEPAPAPAGPVFEAPGVEVIQVEPAPDLRVYEYDPGYPPGCYFYDNYYWYGGYRYPHDMFVNRYVTVNVREHRFMDPAANRREGHAMEQRQRADFARNGGRPAAASANRAGGGGGAAHPAAARPAPAAARPAPAAAPAAGRRR
jgi:hypothetical protein